MTPAQREAAVWAVEHLIVKHDYSSLLSRDGERVDLDELLQALMDEEPQQ